MDPEAGGGGVLAAALAAYDAMCRSKAAYFAVLNEMDLRSREGEAPSLSGNLQLEKLLGAHNEAVSAFTDAMARVTEPGDREALVRELSERAARPLSTGNG